MVGGRQAASSAGEGGECATVPTGRAIETRRVKRVAYIVSAQGELGDRGVVDLVDSVRWLIECGGREVVIDLTAVRAISLAAVDALAALGGELAELDGTLLLAARGPGRGYLLKQVDPKCFEAMFGFHDALDTALYEWIADAIEELL